MWPLLLLVYFISYIHRFYPRPGLAFGYCHHLRLCVCPCMCVYQSLACPHDNSSAVHARITEFGSEMQNTLVKMSIIFGCDRPWPSRSNVTWKSNFTSSWACPHDNFSPVYVRTTRFGPKMHLGMVKMPIVLGVDWPLSSRFSLTWKSKFMPFWACSRDNLSPIQRFAINHRQTFRSIIDITIDLFNSEDWYSQWNTTAPLCLQSRPHLGSRMRVSHSRSTGRPKTDHR